MRGGYRKAERETEREREREREKNLIFNVCSFLFFTYKLDICLKGKYTREGGYEDAITTTDGFGPRVYKLYYIYNI